MRAATAAATTSLDAVFVRTEQRTVERGRQNGSRTDSVYISDPEAQRDFVSG